MQAVIDSSSLIFAFELEEIKELLKTKYDSLLLPKTVYDEVVYTGKKLGKEEVNQIEDEIKKGFLKIQKSDELIEVEHLGKGELEAISLARHEDLPLIMDDKKARIIGVSVGLKVFPVSSFILWGAKEGHLTTKRSKEILNELVKAGYWLKSDVYLSLIEVIESPNQEE